MIIIKLKRRSREREKKNVEANKKKIRWTFSSNAREWEGRERKRNDNNKNKYVVCSMIKLDINQNISNKYTVHNERNPQCHIGTETREGEGWDNCNNIERREIQGMNSSKEREKEKKKKKKRTREWIITSTPSYEQFLEDILCCWIGRFSCSWHRWSMEMDTLPTWIFLLPNTCFFCSKTLCLTISKILHSTLIDPSMKSYRSINCRRRIYAIHADSSPNACTTGVNIVQFIVGFWDYLSIEEKRKRDFTFESFF